MILDQVKQQREALGLSQEEFATAVGVSARTVSRLETGRAPSRTTRKKLHAYFDKNRPVTLASTAVIEEIAELNAPQSVKQAAILGGEPIASALLGCDEAGLGATRELAKILACDEHQVAQALVQDLSENGVNTLLYNWLTVTASDATTIQCNSLEKLALAASQYFFNLSAELGSLPAQQGPIKLNVKKVWALKLAIDRAIEQPVRVEVYLRENKSGYAAELAKPPCARALPVTTSIENPGEQAQEYIEREIAYHGWSEEEDLDDRLEETSAMLDLLNQSAGHVFSYENVSAPTADQLKREIARLLPELRQVQGKKGVGHNILAANVSEANLRAYLVGTLGSTSKRREELNQSEYETKKKENTMGNTFNIVSENAHIVSVDNNNGQIIQSTMGEYSNDSKGLEKLIRELSAAIDQLGTKEALEKSAEFDSLLPAKAADKGYMEKAKTAFDGLSDFATKSDKIAKLAPIGTAIVTALSKVGGS